MVLTAVEAAANCHHHDLGREERAEASKNRAALVVDGVHTNDMDG